MIFKNIFRLTCIILFAGFFLQPCYASRSSASFPKFFRGQNKQRDIQQPGNTSLKPFPDSLPFFFLANRGQWQKEILYQCMSNEGGIRFLRNGISFCMSREVEEDPAAKHKEDEKPEEYEGLVWNMVFDNANPAAIVKEEKSGSSRVNYLIGNDPSKHAIHVPQCGLLTYENIYPHTDLQYYAAGEGRLKYDYLLHPGADISNIRMRYDGIQGLSVNPDGDLEIRHAWGTVTEHLPVSYQYVNGRKETRDVRFILLNNTTAGFRVYGKYNHDLPLVIDPVFMLWSTWIGSSSSSGFTGGSNDGYMNDIAADAAGNVYGVGRYGSNFPVTFGAYSTTHSGPFLQFGDVIVFKLKYDGMSLDYATFVGGSSVEWGLAIDVNAAGETFFTGLTSSDDFPYTPNAYDNSYNGGSAYGDAFLCKLSAGGDSLLYSSYIGGTEGEAGRDIAVRNTNDVYLVGFTTSSDFPVSAAAFDNTFNGAASTFLTTNAGLSAISGDAYVMKMDAGSGTLLYSTYIGGGNAEAATSVTVNSAGEAFVTGGTSSTDFPVTPGSFCTTAPSSGFSDDAFLVKLNSAGSSLVYSTYIGGNNTDGGWGVTINSNNESFVTGFTASDNFPATAGAHKTIHTSADSRDAFVCRLNAAGSSMIYATYVGASDEDYGCDIEVNNANEAFVAGKSDLFQSSGNFPTTGCAYDNSYNGMLDIILFKLSASGDSLYYSSYFGGDRDDYNNIVAGPSIAMPDKCREEVMVGQSSHSTGFPTTIPSMMSGKGNGTGKDQPVIFKMGIQGTNIDFTSSPAAPNCSDTVQFTGTPTGNCIWKNGVWSPGMWLWDFGDGDTSSAQSPSHVYGSPGNYTVTLIVGCPMDTAVHQVVIGNTPPQGFTILPGDTTINAGDTVLLNATVMAGYSYSWSPVSGLSCTTCPNPAAIPANTITYVLTADNGSGCTVTDSITITINPKQDTTTQVVCGEVFVPNAFSPNGDEENEILYVRGNCIKTLTFEIYDRWGNKVFETPDPSKGWDGTYKGETMNSGVFVYHLKAILQNGNTIIRKGNISLLK